MASPHARALRTRQTPKQDRSESTLSALLEAAERIVRESGRDALTLRKLAVVSGFSAATMYRYFRTKEALLLTLEERSWHEHARFFVEKAAEHASAPPEEATRTLIAMMVERIAATITLYGNVLSSEVPAPVVAKRRQLTDLLCAAGAERLAKAPECRHDDAHEAVSVVVYTVLALARVGALQHPELVKSGAWGRHVADMASRYLFRIRSESP